MSQARLEARLRRHKRIRKHTEGTPEKPRLSVYRSLNNLNVQIINDLEGETILSVSTLDKEFRKQYPKGGNVKAAKALGEFLAKKAKDLAVTAVVFDRGGYAYHGRIKAFADSARKAGLKF